MEIEDVTEAAVEEIARLMTKIKELKKEIRGRRYNLADTFTGERTFTEGLLL